MGKSLPHTSRQNPEPHIDNEVNVEGMDETKGETMKTHELTGEEPAEPRSVESLRQRLGSQKG